MVNVAVLGYGTIGSGVVEVLQTNTEVHCTESRRGNSRKVYFGFKRFPW